VAARKQHLVLIGDSIFDNGAYTKGEPDVLAHLERMLPQGWRATSNAVDGATTSGIDVQLRRMPSDATHVAVSIGGNDVLHHARLLTMPVSSTVEALESFAPHVDRFRSDYHATLKRIVATALPTVVCTIYNGRLDRDVATAARMALGLFNDAILRTAAELRVPVIELRDVCDAASDYANPIEPSGSGGKKIAAAIFSAVTHS
jgi:hypothetical protein